MSIRAIRENLIDIKGQGEKFVRNCEMENAIRFEPDSSL